MLKSEELLRRVLSDSRVTRFVETALELSASKQNPYLNYFGFNYDSEKITTVKCYVAFFHRLKPADIVKLIPDPSDLHQYYGDWEESDAITRDHSGCTFALKVSTDLSITNYFHLRLKPRSFATPYFGIPEHLRLSWNELLQYSGVSCEYKNGKSFKRYYFYLTDRISMKNAIERCQDRFFIEEDSVPSFIEYTETEQWCKLIHGIDDPSQLQAYWKYYSLNPMLSDIMEFAATHRLMCVCPGKYEGSDVRSVYLVEKNDRMFRQNSASLRRMYEQFNVSL